MSATTAALLVAIAPSGAARDDGVERRAPLWESGWATEDPFDNDDLWYHTPETLLDPATGDVLALALNQEPGSAYVLRRIDGATGATESEVPVVMTDDVPATAPGAAQQFVDFEDGDRRLHARAIGVDGTALWRQTLSTRGDVQSVHTHPVTGTTCAAIAVRPAKAARGALACVDRSGRVVTERTFARAGRGGGGHLAVTADPRRPRWYVADVRQQREFVDTRVRAFTAKGRAVWTRGWRSSIPRKTLLESEIGAFTVDPKRGRVLLGSTDLRSTRISVWDRTGRALRGKQWGFKKRREIDDIVVTADGSRTFAVYVDQYVRTSVVALRPNMKQQWKLRSPFGSEFNVELMVADDRKQVLVIGAGVTALTWQGRSLWQGDVADGFLGSRGHYDSQRERFIVPWTDSGYPRASVYAFGA